MDDREYRVVIDQAMEMRNADIVAETKRAMSLHPSINTAHEGYAVILEELEEFWGQVKINPNKLSSTQRAERLDKMREELTHTAAMCLRTILDLAL